MKLEEIEITGEGFTLYIDVEADYVDHNSGNDGDRQLYERDLTGVEYPNEDIAKLIKGNPEYRKQVFNQIWERLDNTTMAARIKIAGL